jgi:hypothetical protein
VVRGAAVVSDRRLRRYRRLPRAASRWALDSGGFTELDTHGSWDHGPTPPRTLPWFAVTETRSASSRGRRRRTGCVSRRSSPRPACRSSKHQRRTVENYLTLRALAPDLPFVPVVQGWQINDYLTCVELYAAAGVDLAAAPVVGLGSVCRRQATDEAAEIVDALHLVCVGPRAMRLDERTGTWTLLDGPALDHTVHDTSATILRYVLPLRDTRGGQRSKPTRCAPPETRRGSSLRGIAQLLPPRPATTRRRRNTVDSPPATSRSRPRTGG